MPFICSEKRIFHLVVRFFRTKSSIALGFFGFSLFQSREFIFFSRFFAFLAAIENVAFYLLAIKNNRLKGNMTFPSFWAG
jgi:hypothetical protein